MLILQDQPTLTDLHHIIDKVDQYPTTAEDIVELAKEKGAPRSVIDFYLSFRPDMVFEDQFRLLEITDEVEMLHHQTSPQEGLRVPEED